MEQKIVYGSRTEYGDITLIQKKNLEWGVVDKNGNEIVPFGKYGWMDKFYRGLARVRDHGEYVNPKFHCEYSGGWMLSDEEREVFYTDRNEHPDKYAKWGVINTKGEEVLPLIYDSVWKFVGKKYDTIIAEKDGQEFRFSIDKLNGTLKENHGSYKQHEPYDWANVSEYAGSYAHDIMGYDDDTIDDAFEGDPDACWNVD